MSHSAGAAAPAVSQALDQQHFVELAEPFRAEVQLHCYRMLGSLQDAEDLTQETLLRAWQHLSSFEGRSTFRAWLYRIATNACLDALEHRSRRILPIAINPASDPRLPPASPRHDLPWLDPLPDDQLVDVAPSPEAQYSRRESVSLAFLTALQLLPPRQRAVLLLRDVLDWRASEVAELLSATVSTINSALHRARTTLRKHYHLCGVEGAQTSGPDQAMQGVLDRFMQAWEQDDVEGLIVLLKEDATFSMPPSPSWYQGRAAVGVFLATIVFGGPERGRWRVRMARANGQLATATWGREPDGVYRACAIQVLTVVGGEIADVTNFKDPLLFPRFGLPIELGT